MFKNRSHDSPATGGAGAKNSRIPVAHHGNRLAEWFNLVLASRNYSGPEQKVGAETLMILFDKKASQLLSRLDWTTWAPHQHWAECLAGIRIEN